MLQPSFSCAVSSNLIQDKQFKEYYVMPDSEINFTVSSEIPWNCMNPHLSADSKLIQFKNDKPLVLSSISITIPEDEYDVLYVYLVCSYIRYKCGEYTVYKPVSNSYDYYNIN